LVTVRGASGDRPSDVDFSYTVGAPSCPERELLVCLRAGDWVAYDFGLAAPSRLHLAVKIMRGRAYAAGAANVRGPWLDLIVDDERAEPQATDDEDVMRATTNLRIAAGRHNVRVVGRAPETLLQWIEVLPSTVVEK
jgi:hypothetical protein